VRFGFSDYFQQAVKENDQIDEALFTQWIEQASKIPGEKVF